MRVKFNGPEGAPYEGMTFQAASVEDLTLDDLADLQRAIGLPMSKIQEQVMGRKADPDKGIDAIEGDDILGMKCNLYATLREGGHKVSWEAMGKIRGRDAEFIEEPGDQERAERARQLATDAQDTREAAPAVPPAASTGSLPAAVDATPAEPTDPESSPQ